MTQKSKTILLIIALIVCLSVLGLLIFLFVSPKECPHHFCKKTPHDPTCEGKGYTFYECLMCDYTFEADFVAPLGHQFIDTVVNPDCTTEGHTSHVCSVCQIENIDTYIRPTGHNFEVNITVPSCTSGGYTTYSCTNEACEFKYESDFTKPTGHSMSKISTVAPTCEGEGYSIYKCANSNCTHEYQADFTDSTGHNMSKIFTIPSTCEGEGYSIYKCANSNCAHEHKGDFTDSTGHSMSKILIVDPTCESEGYTIYKCANCTHEHKGDFTDSTGHNMSEISIVDPTCESEGYSVYKCSNGECEHEYTGDRVSPLGHTLKNSTIAPTCESEGYTEYSCENCTYSYVSDIIAPLEHTYEKTYVRPNIEQTGYTIYKCTTCGSEHKADYVFYSDIFAGAEGEGKGSLGLGVDLSHHSYDVDFEALKESGVEFVILRVGYNTSLDTKFEEYYAAAREAGLDIGVYFFTLAESKEDAIADAKRVADWLDGKKFEYPIFYDVEDDPHYSGYAPSTFSEDLIMEIVHAFMTEMVDYGYYPGLYTNNDFLYNLFHSEKTLRLYDVWYARYTTPTSSNTLEYSRLYSMWQFEGNVEGYQGAVSGMCDINYTFKNYPEIIKKFGFNGYQ